MSGKSVGCEETEPLCLTVFLAFGHCVSGQRTPTWKVTQVLFSLQRVAQGSHKHELLSQAGTLAWPAGRGCGKEASQMEDDDSGQGRHVLWGPVSFSFPFRDGLYRSQPL